MVNNKPTKILIISEVFFPEEFLINDLAYYWKGQGQLVSVLTRNPSYPNGRIYKGYKNRLFHKEIIEEIPVHRVQFIPGYKKNDFVKIINYLWNMVLGIIWAVKNGNKFDSIYIYQTGPLTFSSIGIVIKKLYKKRVTIWTQDVWPDTVYAFGFGKTKFSRFLLERFVKWIYSNINTITISSPGFELLIKKYVPEKDIHFIPQWSMTKKSSLSLSSEYADNFKLPGSFNFVFAGNVGKVQNLENVIFGFNRFINSEKKSNVWLNIFGDGSHLKYLQNLTKEHSMSNIKFWGRVSSTYITEYYHHADVLIISLENKPIFNSTIPAKFQSYLNAGRPVFGIIKGEVAQIIINRKLGWIANPDNIDNIAEQFNLIANSNRESLKEIIKNSEDLLNSEFNREVIIEKISHFVLN